MVGCLAFGLRQPASWPRILLIAVAAAVIRNVVGEILVLPIAEHFWPNPQLAPEWASDITGNIKFALLILLVVWTFAAFGEEVAYRGYPVTRIADLGKGSRAAYWIGVVFVSILFGYGHYYKGPAGMMDSGFGGLVFGTAYLLAGRNLWVSILAHGLVDTYGVIVLFFGWAE